MEKRKKNRKREKILGTGDPDKHENNLCRGRKFDKRMKRKGNSSSSSSSRSSGGARGKKSLHTPFWKDNKLGAREWVGERNKGWKTKIKKTREKERERGSLGRSRKCELHITTRNFPDHEYYTHTFYFYWALFSDNLTKWPRSII